MNRKNIKVPEGWEIKKLIDLSIDGINNGIFNDPKKIGKGYKLINVIDLYQGHYISSKNLSLLDLTEDEFKKFKVEKGDVFFTRSSLRLEGIAHCNTFLSSNDEVVYDCHLMRVRPNLRCVIPIYITYYCSIKSTRKYFMARAKQTTMTTISQADIKDLPVILPPLSEQQKIVEILSNWDRGIEKTENLIELKSKRKKGLMQQLLSGKKWFKEFGKETWQNLKLGDLLTFKPRPVIKPQNPYWALGIRSHGKGTFIRKVEEPEKIMMDALFKVKENDLIINITFGWEGAVALVKKNDEGTLVSHRFPTYVFKEDIVSPQFFKQVILQKNFVHNLGVISPGGAGRNRVLSKKDFLKLKIKIPSIKEQQKIAGILSSADREIELLKQQLEKLKKQKKGLMQKLLTGQIRVRSK